MEKERLVKLLKEEARLSRSIARICAEDCKDYIRAAQSQEEARTYEHVINLLEDEAHFEKFCKILKIDEKGGAEQ